MSLEYLGNINFIRHPHKQDNFLYLWFGIVVIGLALICGLMLDKYAFAANTCTSTGNGDWNVTTTWTGCGDVLPQADDDVVIAHNIDIPSGYVINLINDLTINNGASLIQQNTSTQSIAGTLTISGTLTHQSEYSEPLNYAVDFSVDSLVLNSSGEINVDEDGYSGGYNSFPYSGNGPGGGVHDQPIGTGGGHAGAGGDGNADGSASGGSSYGDPNNPMTVGSGGGTGYVNPGSFIYSRGGDGGGLIVLDIANNFTFNGSVSALGGDGSISCPGACTGSGAGAGGSINITAGSITGDPTLLSADGGNASFYGGDGGGGYIYLDVTGDNVITESDGSVTGDHGDDINAGEEGSFIGYNTPPTTTIMYPVQTSGSAVTVTTTISDVDSHETDLIVEYSLDGSTWVSSTIGSVSQGGEGDGVVTSTGSITSIDTDVDGSVDLTFVWDVGSDVPGIEDSEVYLRVIPSGAGVTGDTRTSAAFAIDTLFLTAPGALTLNAVTDSSAILNFGATSTGDNFSEYKIFYKVGSTGVTEGDTAFTSTSDSNLAAATFNDAVTTTISSLSSNTQYVANIWAYDSYANATSSATEVSFYTLAPTPTNVATSAITTSSASFSVDAFDNHNADSSAYLFKLSLTDGDVFVSDSGWQAGDNTWSVDSLSSSTQYTVGVVYRNGDGVLTATTTLDFDTLDDIVLVPAVSSLSAESSTSFSLIIDENGNASTTTYLVHDSVDDTYLQGDGTWDTGEVWHTFEALGSESGTSTMGLSPNTPHTIEVKAKNQSGTTTDYGSSQSIYTLANAPSASTVSVTSTTELDLILDLNSNPTSTEYAICKTTNGSSCAGDGYVQVSGELGESIIWRSYDAWGGASTTTMSGLTPATSYQFLTRARNGNNEETSWSSASSQVYTYATTPTSVSANGASASQITVTWSGEGSAEYYVENITAGENSGWISSQSWSSTGLDAATSYNFRVQARNGDNVTTTWSSTVSGQTQSPGGPPPPPPPPDCSDTDSCPQDANGTVLINEGDLQTERQEVTLTISSDLATHYYEPFEVSAGESCDTEQHLRQFALDGGIARVPFVFSDNLGDKSVCVKFYAPDAANVIFSRNADIELVSEIESWVKINDGATKTKNRRVSVNLFNKNEGYVTIVEVDASVECSSNKVYFPRAVPMTGTKTTFSKRLSEGLGDKKICAKFYTPEEGDVYPYWSNFATAKAYTATIELIDDEIEGKRESVCAHAPARIRSTMLVDRINAVDINGSKIVTTGVEPTDGTGNIYLLKNFDLGIDIRFGGCVETDTYKMYINDRPFTSDDIEHGTIEDVGKGMAEVSMRQYGILTFPDSDVEYKNMSFKMNSDDLYDFAIRYFGYIPPQFYFRIATLAESTEVKAASWMEVQASVGDNIVTFGDAIAMNVKDLTLVDYCDQYPQWCEEASDIDKDGIIDIRDNCPLIANQGQEDSDGDGIGDVCDGTDDIDGDGILDGDDNCVYVANSDQLDTDADGIGDVCDSCLDDATNTCDADTDGDGIWDIYDNCVYVANSDQLDTDGDGIGDVCDEEDPESICGNGIVEDGESCDGSAPDGYYCNLACYLIDITPDSVCGNGVVEEGESCDDGNLSSGDGCSSACVSESNEEDTADTDGGGDEETLPAGNESGNTGGDDSNPIITFVNDIIDKLQTWGEMVYDMVPDIVKKVIDNPQVEEINEKIVVPTIATVGVANVAMGFQLPNIFVFLRYLFGQPIMALRRRKQKKWGVVYDAFTKEPVDLAVVRVIDAATGKVIRSQVTDSRGRYYIVLDRGEYQISVTKAGFIGFSEYLREKNEDAKYINLYHGEVFTIEDDGELNYNIPLDAKGMEAETKKILQDYTSKAWHYIIGLSGVIITAMSFIISPNIVVLAFFFLHLLLFAMVYKFAHKKMPETWGTITVAGAARKLGKVVIRVFDAEYNRLVSTGVSDRKGRYAILVGPSTYYATYEKHGYENKKSDLIDLSSSETNGMGGIIGRDESLEKK